MAFWVSPPGSTWDPVTCHAFGLLSLRTRQWAGEEEKGRRASLRDKGMCLSLWRGGWESLTYFRLIDSHFLKSLSFAYRILLTSVTPINLISKCK